MSWVRRRRSKNPAYKYLQDHERYAPRAGGHFSPGDLAVIIYGIYADPKFMLRTLIGLTWFNLISIVEDAVWARKHRRRRDAHRVKAGPPSPTGLPHATGTPAYRGMDGGNYHEDD